MTTYKMPFIYVFLMGQLDFYLLGIYRCKSGSTLKILIVLYSFFIIFLSNLFYL